MVGEIWGIRADWISPASIVWRGSALAISTRADKDYPRRKTLAIDELDGRPPLDLAILGVTGPVVPPPIHTGFETTYLAGLRKTGVPEE